MKKLLIGTALLFAVLPFTFDGVMPTVSKAHAIIGRPLTPGSFAGMHRRAMRRTFGVGANLGYRGFSHSFRHPVHTAFTYRHRYFTYRFNPHPVRAAVIGAAAGTGWGGSWGWGGGWGGWGWQRPWRPGLYA